MAKKSPFRGYSEEEVNRMENGYYCLIMGGDFVLEQDFYLFTKTEASQLYKATLNDLLDLVDNGNMKDRKYAMNLIPTLMVSPMRLH